MINSLKKAELHVHLEGTVRPELAINLARRNKITIPNGLIAKDKKSYLSKGFHSFLRAYDKLASLIKTPEDYYDITYDYLKESALKNAIYVEMMYSPYHAEKSSGIPACEHLKAIQEAINKAKQQFNIVGRVISTAVRHLGVEICEHTARFSCKEVFPCVTGFGLGGDEARFPPKLFIKAFAIAQDAGLQCTIHAGEFDSAKRIEEAINNLPIKRIGHGVSAACSQETLKLIKDKDVALELCPTSNIFMGLYKGMHDHPLPLFYNAGIKISINSDDPPFMQTDLDHVYQKVQQSCQYSDEVKNHITKMAIEAAFIDEVTRGELLERL